MKKYIIVALLSILSTSVMAQEKGVIDKVATTVGNAVDSGKKAVTDAVHVVDTSSNFRKIYTDVKEGIGALASSLKVGAEHVYKVLVKQQVVKAIGSLILIVLMYVLCAVLYRLSRKTYKAHIELYNKRNNSWNPDLDDTALGVSSVILAIGASLALVIGSMALCHEYNTIFTGLINPEYGAIKDIISIVNP